MGEMNDHHELFAKGDYKDGEIIEANLRRNQMNLKELGKEMPYRWRVQSFSKNKPLASCVAYIDARDAMKLLDEVCGPENWQDDYREIGGLLFGGLAIRVNKEWIWKWDTGSESNIEKEKGHVSDSFKRAGVKWGIGRFLYDLEIQYVNASEKKTGNNYPYVVDDNGKRVWDLTKHINSRNGNNRKATPAPKTPPQGAETGHPSTQAQNKGNGKVISEAQRKRMYAIANQSGIDKEIAKAVVGVFGYESSNDVTVTDYDKIVNVLQVPSLTLAVEIEQKRKTKWASVTSELGEKIDKWLASEKKAESPENIDEKAGRELLATLEKL